MSAAEKVSIRVTLSETDRADGIKVASAYRYARVDKNSGLTFANVICDIEANLLDFTNAKVADNDGFATITYSVRNGKNEEIANGDWASTLAVVPLSSDLNIIASVKYDKVGADNSAADGIDDRAQKVYKVHLETAPGSGVNKVSTSYVANKTDDLTKLVGVEYFGLPGLYDEVYVASQEQVYVYQYSIKGNDIFGTWVKEGSSLFAKGTTTGNVPNTATK